jgi:hypothetical protein
MHEAEPRRPGHLEGAPKQCFPVRQNDTAPAIRTDRTAALHNPLQTITAFNDLNLI